MYMHLAVTRCWRGNW